MGNPAIESGVNLALEHLSNAELATFNNLLGFENDEVRKMCEERPWFKHVEHLFTQDNGQKIHEETRAAIDRIVLQRLS